MKKITYKIQYFLLILTCKILLLFPEKKRFAFAEFIANLGYKLIKKRRITTITNLRMAFPEKDNDEIEEIARESYRIMAKGFLCTLWLKEYLSNSKNIKIVNQEIFDSEYKKGKGLIASLIHMGNMEASLKVAQGKKVVTVAKAQRNPYINDFITKSRREDLNLEVLIKSKQTSKELIEKIEKKEIYALFSDHRDKGAEVEFFGMTTKAPTGAISLALRFDVPLVLGYNYFNKDNTTTIVIEKIDLVKTDNFKHDVAINTQNLINKMEEVIRKHPEQWMWFHDRWNLYRQIHRKKK